MRKSSGISLQPGPMIALALGVACFFYITDPSILLSWNTSWLSTGDPAFHWLGWEFFRQTPLLQWPLGANPGYGIEISSSIVFSDSIPLLAFIFRPLHSILPTPFQYLGLWLLLCIVLQAWFAWKILSILTTNRWLPLMASLFFAIAPAFLYRFHGQ